MARQNGAATAPAVAQQPTLPPEEPSAMAVQNEAVMSPAAAPVASFSCGLCPHARISTKPGLIKHVNLEHLQREGFEAYGRSSHCRVFLERTNRWLCSSCGRCSVDLSRRNCPSASCLGSRDQADASARPHSAAAPRSGDADNPIRGLPAAGPSGAGDGPPPPTPPPSLQQQLLCRLPTSKHIPRQARGLVAKEYALLLQAVADPDSQCEEAWCRLNMFIPSVLRPDPRLRRGGKRRRQRSPDSFCVQLVRRWAAGEQAELWAEAVAAAEDSRARPRRASSARESNLRRAKGAASEGRFATAIKALSSKGHAADSAETVAKLRKLHPVHPLPEALEGAAPEPFVFSAEEVRSCISSFPSGSAGGCMGLRPQHLKEITDRTPVSADARQALSQLTRVVNLLVAGQAHQNVMEAMASAPLYALAKKDGGIRPIAVGESIRRLVSKCCCLRSKSLAAAHLSPLQVGVGVPGGCEAVIHSVSTALEKYGDDPDMVMLKIDFTNAFNRIGRTPFLKLLHESEEFGGMYRWVQACYGIRSSLLFGPHLIDSLAGVQQGDPLGPLLFSLVLHTLVCKVKAAVPGLALNVWFLDDGTLIGKTDDVRAAERIIREEGQALGMDINHDKCELWWPSHNPRMHLFPAKIKRVPTAGVELLGCALGAASFVAAHLEKRVGKAEAALEELALFEDGQVELLLLRSCLGLPKLGYSMRTTPPVKIGAALARFHGLLIASLNRIVGSPLDDAARAQAALPIKWGGLGILDPARTAYAAFVSSSLQTRSLQAAILGAQDWTVPGTQAALDALSALLPGRAMGEDTAGHEPRWTLEGLGEELPRQRTLLEPVYEAAFAQLTSAGSLFDKARLRACASDTAGAFLTALPVPWMKLDSREMSIACKLRLGLPVYPRSERNGLCPACKNHTLDPQGHHALICSSQGDRISRHNHLCVVLATFIRSCAHGLVTMETPGLIPGSGDKPGDVTMTNWHQGKTACFDVTAVSPFAESCVTRAATVCGFAAAAAEERKDSKAFDKCEAQGLHFVPLAVEVFGTWGKLACEAFGTLADLAAGRSGRTRAEELNQFLQRMAIALQRDNAHMVQSRAPEYVPLEGLTPPR